ncbi:MAG: isocitrate lyase/phosphoenolpyruvate mutase family protein [Pseudomonadota bacterium]
MTDRHSLFQSLHVKGAAFVIPNPWDMGSARVMAAMGAQALATTSSGFAFTQGLPDDGSITRDQALAHAEDIVAATSLPVSGDLENGFGESPDDVVETVKGAAEIGLSGCAIEDTALPTMDAYDFELAVERIKAGVAAARALSRPFMLCARADGYLTKAYDADEALRRIAAFDAAGADVLYAPTLKEADLARMVAATETPVNALAHNRNTDIPRSRYKDMGVARISIGGAMMRTMVATIHDTTKAILNDGDFSGLAPGATVDVEALLAKGASSPE